jgi:probable rRNA maturation factor
LGWAEAELSLTLVGDRAMALLNRETFGRRGPTNVIAFPLEDQPRRGGAHTAPSDSGGIPAVLKPQAFPVATPNGPPAMLGEVVISVETTIRQAQETGWPWQELLDFFLIHGILHLLGYDHEDPATEAQMDAKSWELLALLHPKMKEG